MLQLTYAVTADDIGSGASGIHAVIADIYLQMFKRPYAVLLLELQVQHKYINLLLLVVVQQTHFYC